MQFAFVTVISISTSETQGLAYTVSEPREEKQSKNLTSCVPAFWLVGFNWDLFG